MTNVDHLRNDLLVRAIDDELSAAEAALVARHLSGCEACKKRYQDLNVLSAEVERLVAGINPGRSYAERESLAKNLEPGPAFGVLGRTSSEMFRRVSWMAAVAAILAIGVMLAPRLRHGMKTNEPVVSTAENTGTIDINGESFVVLPYSNRDLPLSAPRVVQMQLPISSLSAAGVIPEPVSSEFSALNGSVLADVLVGVDGQAIGVHVADVD